MQETPLSPILCAHDYEALFSQWKGRKVAVCGHLRPDGDCIGSQVALTRFLRDRDIDAVAVLADEVPRTLESFIGKTPFVDAGSEDLTGRDAILVDCADAGRIGKVLADRFSRIILNIDHHISNPAFAEHNLVVSHASATAEILAELFITMGYQMDSVTANALYVGIATDTGQFRFQSTTTRTFEICCHLCEYGAKPASVATTLYEQEKFGRMELLQRFLSTLKLELHGRICTGCIHQGDYEETGTTNEDSEGFVDYSRSIEGVCIGVFLEESDGFIKGSFRSKDPVYRVDGLAQIFNGGGHACAAGFRVQNTIEKFYPELVNALSRHLDQINS